MLDHEGTVEVAENEDSIYSRTRLTDLKDRIEEANIYIKNRNLSKSQQKIVSKVFAYFTQVAKFKANKPPNKHISFQELYSKSICPPRLLLTGDPGSGKSYTTETIVELATILNLGSVATTSYNGIAAVNVDGSTICSMFAIFETSDASKCKTLDSDTVANLRNKLNIDSMCFLVIDEVSTIDSRIVALLDLRLRQITAAELPFGGIPILFTGDFNQ